MARQSKSVCSKPRFPEDFMTERQRVSGIIMRRSRRDSSLNVGAPDRSQVQVYQFQAGASTQAGRKGGACKAGPPTFATRPSPVVYGAWFCRPSCSATCRFTDLLFPRLAGLSCKLRARNDSGNAEGAGARVTTRTQARTSTSIRSRAGTRAGRYHCQCATPLPWFRRRNRPATLDQPSLRDCLRTRLAV